MTLLVLRDDALRLLPDGFELLVNLPWIRSLPIESLRNPVVLVDGQSVPVEVDAQSTWWHVQDRVSLRGSSPLTQSAHEVTVSFELVVPYLQSGPDGPLALPFRESRTLMPTDRWTLTTSAFNWTPAVIRGERAADEVAVDVVRAGIADVIEIEAGQVWRSFPTPSDSDVDSLRTKLDAAGGRVSIVGASIDDWTPGGRRRTDEERASFLIPQLRAAARVGALGARVPLGQAGAELLRMLQPTLEELDITLFEEAQGHQTPQAAASAFEDISTLDDPRIRVLVDISILMPALPVTYLERLRAAGLPAEFIALVETQWQDPSTHQAVIDLLRSGGVPGSIRTLYMNMLVRFGRSDAADLRGILPLVSGIHLKFWDLDDADQRITRPIREVGVELRAAEFTGTMCSEWGGHEWLDDDPGEMTRAHLALAASALTLP